MAEVAYRRPDRGIRPVDDDHREAPPNSGVGRAEADDPRTHDDEIRAALSAVALSRAVLSAVHRNTFRIHIASPSTTSTVTRIISTIAVTVS